MKKYKLLNLLLTLVIFGVAALKVAGWNVTDSPVSIGFLGPGNVYQYGNNNWIQLDFDSSGNIYVMQENAVNVIRVYDSNFNYLREFGDIGTGNGQLQRPRGIAVYGNYVYIADSSNNRVQKFTLTGTYVTKWGSLGTGNGQFNRPQGVDVDSNGNVYVVDRNNHRVQKFDSDGNYLDKIGSQGSGDGQFFQPWAISITPDDSIWVGDNSNSRLQKLDTNLDFVLKTGSFGTADGQFNFLNGISTDTSGNVYAVDGIGGAPSRVQKFNSSGVYQSQFGSYGTGDGQFSYPSGLAINASGRIYVSDNTSGAVADRIQWFTSSGVFEGKIGSRYDDAGQTLRPWGIGVDSTDIVYLADSSLDTILKFSSSGTYLTQWGSSGSSDGQLLGPYGLAIDENGNIVVSDSSNNRIQLFSNTGSYISQFGSAGAGNGQFNTPMGIAIDSDGNIYVADAGNNRVQKFDSSQVYQTSLLGNGGNFNYPEAVYVDSNGNIYVADSGNSRVQKFDSSLNFELEITGYGTAFDYPDGITGDSEGNIYISDAVNDEIQIFTSSGSYLTTLGGSGEALGKFNGPSGMVFDSTGKLHISDTVNARVQTFVYDRNTASITIVSLTGNSTTDTTPTFSGEVTDTTSDVTSVEYALSINPNTWLPCVAQDGTFDELNEGYACTVDVLTTDTSYTLNIRATDSYGNTNSGDSLGTYNFTIDRTLGYSGTSSTVSTYAPPGSFPLIYASEVTTTQVTLKFIPGVGPLTHYAAFYGTDGTFEYGINPLGNSDAKQVTIAGLSPDTTYYFLLQPMNNYMPGPKTPIYAARTQKEPSLGPTEITIENVENPEDAAESYDINILLTDQTDEPIEGATITLSNQASGQTYSAETSDTGAAHLIRVAEGIYEVDIAKGQVLAEQTIVIDALSDKIIRIKLGEAIAEESGLINEVSARQQSENSAKQIYSDLTGSLRDIITPDNAVRTVKTGAAAVGIWIGTSMLVGMSNAYMAIVRSLPIASPTPLRPETNRTYFFLSSLRQWLANGLFRYLPFAASIRRRRRKPGYVFDSMTSDPVKGAFVIFYSASGNLKTDFTDQLGCYFVNLHPDEYEIRVDHSQYLFPSQLYRHDDHKFSKVYIPGKKIRVEVDEAHICDIAIPLDPKTLSPLQRKLTVLVNGGGRILQPLILPLECGAIFISTIAVLANVSWLNIGALVLTFGWGVSRLVKYALKE